MGMILLHHNESELSRELLAAAGADVDLVDCTTGVPAAYDGPQPSAYPSVVVDVPGYMTDRPMLDADGGLLGMGRVPVEAHQEALRMPVSWEAVGQYMNYVRARATANPLE